MLSFSLGLVLGIVGGFIGGVFYYAKKVHKNITGETITREAINSLVMETPKGDFIRVNAVAEYLKNHDGDVKLSDILEDEER